MRAALPSDDKLMHVHQHGRRGGEIQTRTYPKLPYRVRLRIVCDPCNTRWMSRLEDAAKPIALPMILGETVTLGERAQTALSAWAILKGMVTDFSASDPVIPSEHRADLFRTRGKEGPPWYTRVWVGRYEGNRYPATAGIGGLGLTPTDPDSPSGDRDAYFAVFGVERLVLVVFGHTVPDEIEYALTGRSAAALDQIWPVERPEVVFPSNVRLTDAGLRALVEDLTQRAF